jgi:outer membrane protein assembly factor BamB
VRERVLEEAAMQTKLTITGEERVYNRLHTIVGRLSSIIPIGALVLSQLAAGQEPASHTANWPQFRGANGAAVAQEGMKLPTSLEKNIIWKVGLPPGASSPCVWGDRVFLTSFKKKEKILETLCFDRRAKRILWRRTAPTEHIEKVHQVSSPAAATPATDGEAVYVYFGSCGVLCYDFDGNERWKIPLPAPKTMFGTASSPLVVGDVVVLNHDHQPEPFLLAVNRRTGATVWKHAYGHPTEGFPASRETYSTPAIRRQGDTVELIIHTNRRLAAHSLKDGSERWWIFITSEAASTPIIEDGLVYVSTWVHAGEPENRVALPSFDEMLRKYDKNKDGKLSKDEIPADLSFVRRTEAGNLPGAALTVHLFFDFIDANHDGALDRGEWTQVEQAAKQMPTEHGVLAIRPGEKGDVSATNIAWKEKHGVPETSSPLHYRGRIYLAKEGGIVSCLDAKTGHVIYRERVGATGPYFASPVAGDGKVYVSSYRGTITVLAAGDQFKVLARHDLGEQIMATPALADGKVFVRTNKHLYEFGD